MIQQAFAIYGEEMQNSNLFIEHGSHHIACWAKHNHTAQIEAFELFRFPGQEATGVPQLVDHVFSHSKILQHSFTKRILIYEHSACICIPEKFYAAETARAYLQLMLGDDIHTDMDTKMCKNIAIVSSSPADVIKAWNKKIKIDEHAHKYLTLIKQQMNGGNETTLYCIFYTSYFILSAYKNKQLLLIRHFDYSVPEDVLYHILNTCRQLDIDTKNPVIISGSIDTDSALYQMLRSYINQLTIQKADAGKYTTPGFDAYPLHYFTPFCEYDV